MVFKTIKNNSASFLEIKLFAENSRKGAKNLLLPKS